MHQAGENGTELKDKAHLGVRLTIRPLYTTCFKRRNLTKQNHFKWELGQVLATVLNNFGRQWQQPNSNWLKQTRGIYWLKGCGGFSIRHSWIQAQTAS